MEWRRFNGEPITQPILEAVEKTLIRENEAGGQA